MKEQLVSFETAKLAKGKGFDEYTDYIFITHHSHPVKTHHKDKNSDNNEVYSDGCWEQEYFVCSAPSQSLLQKWLRDEHNIDVWAQPFVVERSNGDPYIADESYSYFLFKDGVFIDDGVDYLDFEDALESGLYEALKLINGTN